jgi:hypothetical protein
LSDHIHFKNLQELSLPCSVKQLSNSSGLQPAFISQNSKTDTKTAKLKKNVAGSTPSVFTCEINEYSKKTG